MKKLSVLHITPWFPTAENKMEGVFILEHIKSLAPFTDNKVIHLHFGNQSQQNVHELDGISVTQITLKPILDKWLIKEKLAARKVDQVIARHQANCAIVNFHIAYPNAIKIGHLKAKYPQLKFVITEHWTAYRHHFNLAEQSKGRQRMAAIFAHKIPVITVSNALKEDIQRFSGHSDFKTYIVPNIIRTDLFTYTKKSHPAPFVFSSINNWNAMKNPELLIRAFKQLVQKDLDVKLLLGGDGELLKKMKALVQSLNLTHKVEFKGRLTKNEVAQTLENSHVYVQSSNYETFSVITAEALSTGTPVIATKVGGLLDFVNESNGVLVAEMEIENWTAALEKIIGDYPQFDRITIAEKAQHLFNRETIGAQYYATLTKIRDEK